MPARKWIKGVVARVWSLDLEFISVPDQTPEEIAASRDFSLILPIHDAPDFLARCLESLEPCAGEAEIVLVDDGSQLAATARLIRDVVSRRGWRLVVHREAQRHSRACEAGARLATRPYLCFLNTDCIWTRRVWEPVRDAFADPDVAMVGPSISNAPGQTASRRSAWCARHWSNDHVHAFAERYLRRPPVPEVVEVPEVHGSAMFIRRAVWEKLGGFHPDLPDYGNETELCRRVQAAGGKLVWTRRAYVHHFGCASYGRVMSMQEVRSRHLAARKLIDSLPPQERLAPFRAQG